MKVGSGRQPGRRRALLIGAAIALAVFGLIAGLRAAGYLERLEYGAADYRARLLEHEVPSDIVIVGIDKQSLDEYGKWPWPRSRHAQLIDRLREANPKQLFIDIDFSLTSRAEEDAQLETSLAAWKVARPDSPIILPVYVQSATGSGEAQSLTLPLEQFIPHVRLGSVNQQTGRDSLVRNTLKAIADAGQVFPSAISRLTGKPSAVPGQMAALDFSISPGSFGVVSYSDVIAGRIDPAELAGKTVMVGNIAIELGDMLPVPVHGSMAGVILQALGVQTAHEGALRELMPAAYLALLAVWTLLCTILFCLGSWKRNLVVLAGALAVIAGVSLYAYAAHRLALEGMPFALCALTAFVVVNLISLEEHIKERQAQRRRLEFQAKHDALTELPNRVALAEHLDKVLPAALSGESVALLMLDLCRFKEVNDTLGHNVGDAVLCEVAQRFRERIAGNNGFIARIGGDEFTVVMHGVREVSAVEALSQELQQCLVRPIDAAGIALDVGLSIGIATYPKDAEDSQSLLKRADVAMYLAKRQGLPFQHYDPAQDEHSVRRLTMVTELRAALANDSIELWYQPQVNLKTRRVESMEALLRWRHPVLGAVSPVEFIPVAEATDLIRPLTDWTLRRALQEVTRFKARGTEIRVGVNISARMLQDSCFPERLRELLQASGVEPHLLEVEITESAMMFDPQRAVRIVNEIHAMGVLISIDDYGTGFSSLSYLRDLPIHSLKLDKSFVIDMKSRNDNRVIVGSTADMARALNLKSVAEGVETPWHASFLAAAGYDYAQGYCYSAAISPDRLAEWVERFNAAARDGFAA